MLDSRGINLSVNTKKLPTLFGWPIHRTLWLHQVPFNLHGPHGILHHLEYLLETKGSAVVCVAEGAGQVSMIIFYLLGLQNGSNLSVMSLSRQMHMKINFPPSLAA